MQLLLQPTIVASKRKRDREKERDRAESYMPAQTRPKRARTSTREASYFDYDYGEESVNYIPAEPIRRPVFDANLYGFFLLVTDESQGEASASGRCRSRP